MPITTLSSKGQIVIPKNLREGLGLTTGARVFLKRVDDHLELAPVPGDPVKHFLGIFKDGPSLTQALIKERKREKRREGKKSA